MERTLIKNLLRTALKAWAIAVSMTILSVSHAAEKSEEKRSDVRLLIDISGSMKKNDPNNLRIPALRIVTNLMPKGSDSGVWTFGRYVNMLVPLKAVDKEWQESANAAAAKINSAGLYTNIGDAMTKSTWDWNRPDDTESRSMILLTDGMVDISKDPAKDAAERQRILNDVLPRLKAAGVTIHTIALSPEADSELLSTLANQTDGWFQQVNSAEDLQRTFLKIFEQATPRDSLPLENNQFTVDKSVEEMTLLVFREAGSSPTRLTTPDGGNIDKNSSRVDTRWFSSSAYDLITISEPPAGDWKIDAAVDPDNRVMVVSKLGLSVDELPNNVLANEQITYAVKLIEDGKVITRPDFIKLIDAKLETQYKGQSNTTPLLRNDQAGEFKQVFFAGEEDGVLEIKLVVKSPTFERSRTHAINIYGNPVQADLEQSFNETEPHIVHLRIAEDVVDLSSLRVTGEIKYPDETSQFIVLESFDKKQSFELKQFPKGGIFKVNLKAEGQSPTGRKFASEIPEIAFEMEPLPGFEPEEPKEEIKPEPEPEKKPEPEPEKKPEPEPVPEPEVKEEPKEEPKDEPELEPAPEKEPVNWTLWLSVGFGGNLLLILLGWLGWRIIRKRSHESNESMAQELFDDEEEDKNVSEEKE
ncbi:vWA domain-containing protein [Pleionea sediminis]|uniref:vWA domain-containing protein n=1 Tax=Pleionea sediminis TaxID=2569479 RepID=UPI001184E2C4|nr:vWA domain-containing protein [Pleionea sediminis]